MAAPAQIFQAEEDTSKKVIFPVNQQKAFPK